MKENNTPTEPPYLTVVDIYFQYWLEHILPIREEKRRAVFCCLLVDVISRLYGMEAMALLGFRMIDHSMDQRRLDDPEGVIHQFPSTP